MLYGNNALKYQYFYEIARIEIISLCNKSVSNKSHCCSLLPRSPLRPQPLVNQAIVCVCRAADNGSLSLDQCRRPGFASATRSPSLFTENKSIFSARVSFGKPHTTPLQDCYSRYTQVQMALLDAPAFALISSLNLYTRAYFL